MSMKAASLAQMLSVIEQQYRRDNRGRIPVDNIETQFGFMLENRKAGKMSKDDEEAFLEFLIRCLFADPEVPETRVVPEKGKDLAARIIDFYGYENLYLSIIAFVGRQREMSKVPTPFAVQFILNRPAEMLALSSEVRKPLVLTPGHAQRWARVTQLYLPFPGMWTKVAQAMLRAGISHAEVWKLLFLFVKDARWFFESLTSSEDKQNLCVYVTELWHEVSEMARNMAAGTMKSGEAMNTVMEAVMQLQKLGSYSSPLCLRAKVKGMARVAKALKLDLRRQMWTEKAWLAVEDAFPKIMAALKEDGDALTRKYLAIVDAVERESTSLDESLMTPKEVAEVKAYLRMQM